MRSTSLSLILGVSLVVSLTGCETKIEGSKIEADIKDNCQKAGLTLKAVSCPAGTHKAGESVECEVTDQLGNTSPFKVSVGKEHIQFMGVRSLDLTKLAPALAPAAGGTITCPPMKILGAAGAKWTCEWAGAAGKKTVAYVIDDKGNIHHDASGDKGAAQVAVPEPPEDADEKASQALTE